MKKRILGFLLTACMVFAMVPATMHGATTCVDCTGTNVEEQNYDRYASPIESYLTVNTDGSWMSVKYISGYGDNGAVLAEYYDASYNLTDVNIVEMDAASPIFGGFYATDGNYFLLTGQTNTEESADVEVYRITKYDREWNKIASVGLKGANTTVPFDAGSARFDICGNYLLIRTSHEMYTSHDGLNHQSNVTIQLDMETMTITDSYTGVMNNNYGYVSHSFNQFIKVEDNKIVAVDHGDAHPRSIALIKYQTDVSTGTFTPTYYTQCSIIHVLPFSEDDYGNNVTGASVGGFEISDNTYLVAGNSVLQDENYLTNTTRNVFVASVDKSNSAVTMNWITNYAEGDGTTSTPQLVEIADNSYMLLWSRNGSVYYTKIDGSGQQVGDIYSMEGALSDCVPVVNNGDLTWYTWEDEITTFYHINLSDLGTKVTPVETGHQWNNKGVTDGVASLECPKCGETKLVDVVTGYYVFWNDKISGSYSSATPAPARVVGDELYFMISNFTPSDANTEMEIVISNPDVISMEIMEGWTPTVRKLTMLEAGEVSINIYPKYNPDLAQTYKFIVSSSDSEEETTFGLTRATLALENDITVIFKAPASYDETYNDMYVRVVQEKENGDTETQYIHGVKNGEYYEFAYTGVNAKEVADNLDATIYGYDTRGNLVTGETLEDYSVKQYCMNQLEKADSLGLSDTKAAALKTLLVDLLNYGTEAQNHFNYKTTTPANGELTDEQKKYASADNVIANGNLTDRTDAEYVKIQNPSATWQSVGLNLLSKTNIRVKFAYEGNISNVVLHVSVNGGEAIIIDEFETTEDGYYYAFFDQIYATQYGVPVEFTLKVNNTAISNTLCYSVESYGVKYKDHDSVGGVVSALMKYGKAAATYKSVE